MRLSNYLDNAMSMQYFASFKCFINFGIVVNHGLLYTWTVDLTGPDNLSISTSYLSMDFFIPGL